MFFQVFKENEVEHYVVTSSPKHSNWMHYVQQTNDTCRGADNSLACQLDSDIFFYTVKSIPADTEIEVTYSQEYAERLNSLPLQDTKRSLSKC